MYDIENLNGEVIRQLDAFQYDEAFLGVYNYISQVEVSCNEIGHSKVANYMRLRDKSSKPYGFIMSYNSIESQLRFQKIRKHKLICKFMYKSLSGKPDEFFKNSYEYDAMQFIKDMEPRRREILNHPDDYKRLYECMEDNKSKETFICVLMAALTYKYEWYERICPCNIETEYWPEDIFGRFDNEVIVDCGAFTGDTAQAMLERFGGNKIKSYYMYEPEESNANTAIQAFAQYTNFRVTCAAVSDKSGEIRFSGAGMSGKTEECGDIIIPALSIDESIAEPISFVKMDIEGAENPALMGAAEHISTNTPKLAICAYHKPDDLRVLIGTIKKINPDYRIFLRHYSIKHKETVIYAMK